ncbi:response regulator [uncultured Methylobacterium sp.]|uniref:response regulator n=1 Tax=uncultured Methylobacterium sp. TaxID=157278 RepID=UPI0035C9F8FD
MNDEPLRVLIVEDEAVLVMQLEMLVEDRGHVVVGTAYSASEAIALARATRPDLAFVDLQLQGRSSGIDVARAIRDMEGVTIVFVTANAAALADDFEGGAAVIAKPFSVALMRNSLPYIEQCVRQPPPKLDLPLGMRLAPAYLAHLESLRAGTTISAVTKAL